MPFEDETRKRYLSLTGHLRPCYPPQSNVSMAASRRMISPNLLKHYHTQ